MSEFDIFFDDYENKHNCSPEKYECFEADQQSQQGEVNKLQTKIDELQARVDDLIELNRLKTIALQQSVNRTSIHVHEKIVALEDKLK